MPDTETAAQGQSDLSAQAAPATNSAGSDSASLSKESITEILAEALFRAEQRGSSKSHSGSDRAVGPTDSKNPPESSGQSNLLSDIEQNSSPPGSKKKSSARSKSSSQEPSARSGVFKVASTAQTKRKLASFQKQHKQLALVIDELLNQLE
jgi:hypothetical protein